MEGVVLIGLYKTRPCALTHHSA